ncbi:MULTISPECIES: TlpA disulfide reductase family protein [unclassified Spirosoma]|uniref:TlpA family protein disulfide reductase n=1 Tax=unclassified Spirosoma TaxID=2621999 RepID=UPI0009671EE5|nr:MULTISPECIES: TlpA disulfide reductase family protein [unclassified Spirosoma]MBN8820728.1 TlpA family protein disulfide reductase [Spirosoma sp.]OJW79438.1 MAG: redoxin [Spirosoma sp. 48-14]
MNLYRFILVLILLGFRSSLAQSLYQGPQPETLFTSAAEKEFLTEFANKFKADYDAPSQYAKLQATGIDAWEMSLFDARKAQLAFYKSHPKENTFSDAFRKFIDARIRWNYWHLLLAYPIIRGNAQPSLASLNALPSVMTEELASLTVNDEAALPADSYQNFLFYYVTYFNAKARNFVKYTTADIQTSLPDKASFARQRLTGKPYQYALARLLVENCEKATPSSVRDVFNLLNATPNAAGYATAVKARCGEVMARKDEPVATASKKRTIAPNTFSFVNQSGEPVILDDFKGKVVYLDVWASWCGPCRAEFPFSKQLQERLTQKQKEQIVFLYLSIDDNEDIWKRALNTLQLQGEQGLSTGGWKSRTVQYFGIQSIPRYILINKKGQIVDDNAKRPSMTDALLQDILKLTAE